MSGELDGPWLTVLAWTVFAAAAMPTAEPLVPANAARRAAEMADAMTLEWAERLVRAGAPEEIVEAAKKIATKTAGAP